MVGNPVVRKGRGSKDVRVVFMCLNQGHVLALAS